METGPPTSQEPPPHPRPGPPGLLSRRLGFWIWRLVVRGTMKCLEPEDLPELIPSLCAREVTARADEYWEAELRRG